MTANDLRPYQQSFLADYRQALLAGSRSILGVAPTGSGKTKMAVAIIQEMAQARMDVLVVAHTREIIQQTADELRDHGVTCGIIMAGEKQRSLEYVQVATIQTLHSRCVRSDTMKLPPADLLWFDEAHRCPANSYRAVASAYPDAFILGTTATPIRSDGRGLGSIFETMIETPQVAELTGLGFLVPAKVFAPVINFDLTGIKTVAGDYHQGQLGERMDQPKLIGDIVVHWFKYGQRRRTFAFCVNVRHSIHLRDEFIRAGVKAEHIDGSTPKDERDATLARLASGEIEVVCNCQVLVEGFDCPPAGCLILACPTKSMGRYRQMAGRVLRPWPGKTDCIILDHSGAVYRHGFVDDPMLWTLEEDRKAENPKHDARTNGYGPRLLECTECGALRQAGLPCPGCGFLPQRAPKAVFVADGELGEVGRDRRASAGILDPAARARWHSMIAYIAAERGYQRGWVSHQYKDKFGTWPAWGASLAPIPPTPEVRSWVRSRMIRYAKGRRSA